MMNKLCLINSMINLVIKNNLFYSRVILRLSIFIFLSFLMFKDLACMEVKEKVIACYLKDELIPNDEINIRKADRTRDSKSFLSYFIGCVMGRYSLDMEGIIYAGGEWNDSKYRTFHPNKYGLIHLTDEHYFEDDIFARLREFLSVTFGLETVEENLQWLAESLELKRNETAEERLRRYFLDEFFKDHCQMYQKRPNKARKFSRKSEKNKLSYAFCQFSRFFEKSKANL